MRNTTVPAQITTVEDKIAGSLSLKQVLILSSSAFFDFVIYLLPPGSLKPTTYKICLITATTLLVCAGAVRHKNKLLFQWVIILLSYQLRTKTYVYNKNCDYLRDNDRFDKPKAFEVSPKRHKPVLSVSNNEPTSNELLKMKQIVDSQKITLSFAAKKGSLRVYVSESK